MFAAQDIPPGAAIWRLDPAFDRLIPAVDLPKLSEVTQAFVERYAYPLPTDPSILVLEVDNGRFMNHAENPNTDFSEPSGGTARRDIGAGEELTCNYGEFFGSFELLAPVAEG